MRVPTHRFLALSAASWFLALTACDAGKPAAPPPPPAQPEASAQGGTVDSVLDYATGATQLRAKKQAENMLSKVNAAREAQQKAIEQLEEP